MSILIFPKRNGGLDIVFPLLLVRVPNHYVELLPEVTLIHDKVTQGVLRRKAHSNNLHLLQIS